VYDFIAAFVERNGYSPSFEEIGQGLDLSSLATVHKHITNLERKGLLKREQNRSRSIDVLPMRARKAARLQDPALPLVGRIGADHRSRRSRAGARARHRRAAKIQPIKTSLAMGFTGGQLCAGCRKPEFLRLRRRSGIKRSTAIVD